MSTTEKTQPGKPDKQKLQVEQQIFHSLIELVALYPKYTIAQHLAGILRKKNPAIKEFYFWDNATLLKRVESYKDELENEEIIYNEGTDIGID